MAMLLVVATTEATDPTRVSVSFRTTANVSESSSVRLRGDTRGVNGTSGPHHLEKEVKHGC
jgi:hypothetical protein